MSFRRADGGGRARCSRRSGSWRPTAGCRRRRATASSTAGSSRRAGCRSSSTRPSRTRLAHTVVAFYVTTAFVVLAVAAFYRLRGRFADEARTMMSMTLWLLTVLVPLQIVLGDAARAEHARTTSRPRWRRWRRTGHAEPRAPLILFAIPDEARRDEPRRDRDPAAGQPDPDPQLRRGGQRAEGVPPAATGRRWPMPFFAFRIMVGIGLLMLALVAASWFLRWRAHGCTARAGSCGSARSWGRPASSPCWPAGPSRRSGASPGPCTA